MARAKKQTMVVTGQSGIELIEKPFLPGFQPVQPRQLEELPVPQASVPGEEVEPPQEEQAEELVEQPAEAEIQEEPEATPEVIAEEKPPVKRELSEVLKETLEAMGYSEEYIKKVYDEKRLEEEKIEKKVNDWRGKLIAVREIIAEIEERFAFVKEARKNLDGYVQGELGLVFDEEPTKTSAEAQKVPVEPEACTEIAEEAPVEEPAQAEEELSESEQALNEVIDALGGEPEDDVPF
ncbi:MAG: hypothetical protein AB2L14_25400 [Candidatus Xenobiia bacterium LiM19]